MTLPVALRKALSIVQHEKRAAYLQSRSARYRLIPDGQRPCGYAIHLSPRYDNAWQPWGEVSHFGVDDILCDKWILT